MLVQKLYDRQKESKRLDALKLIEINMKNKLPFSEPLWVPDPIHANLSFRQVHLSCTSVYRNWRGAIFFQPNHFVYAEVRVVR